MDTEFIRSQPDQTVIPNIYVTHVVECPWGSYPMMVYNYYDYDMEHVRMYYDQCKTEEGWQKYCEEYITSVNSHMEFLQKMGIERLMKLKAKKPLPILRGGKMKMSKRYAKPGEFTTLEFMAVCGSKQIKNGEVVFIGTGLPLIAAMLAKRTHAPGARIVYRSWIYRFKRQRHSTINSRL